MRCFIFFVIASTAFSADFNFIPQLDDERLAKKLAESREFQGRHLNYHAGAFKSSFREVGPPGATHTLGGTEFPWVTPGGRRRLGLTRKFVWPPQPRAKFVTAHYRPLAGQQRDYSRPAWLWPTGTTIFEVHYHAAGHPFEVRVLEKTSSGEGTFNECVEPHIFRPFQSAEDLPFRAQRVALNDNKIRSRHRRKPFVATARVSVYLDTDVDWLQLVKDVGPWPDDLGHEWHHQGAGDRWLTPKKYLGWIIGNGDTCHKCHETAGEPVVYQDPRREWYGFHRGSDFIFSLHPQRAEKKQIVQVRSQPQKQAFTFVPQTRARVSYGYQSQFLLSYPSFNYGASQQCVGDS